MIILHGALVDDELFLWGETPQEPASAKGRRSRAPRPYPYDAGAEAVTRAARELPIGFRPTARRKETATAWLPTLKNEPMPSSALIGEGPDAELSEDALSVAPWKVEGVSLSMGEGLDLLSGYGQRAETLHGILGGPDLKFWVRAVRLAGSLVARQRYLPGVVQDEDGEVRAVWQPVWITEDDRALEELARSMPAAARALTPNGADAPQEAPLAVVKRYVERLVDHVVRTHEEPDAEEAAAPSMPRHANGSDATVHDRWLAALRSDDARVRGSDEEVEGLVEQIREWRKPLDAVVGAPFRLCFRLEEPAPPKEEPRQQRRGRGRRNGRQRQTRDAVRPGQRRWYVRYLLQGTDDPTLIVPTADAWILRGRKAAALQRSGFDVHQTLLVSLAQAAGVCPRIEASLRSRKPSGYSLDARGAHEFLTVTAPALEQAGFGTVLPDWWTGASTEHQLGVRARVQVPEQGDPDAEAPSVDDLVTFDWEICLAGKPLSARDLEELARLKEPLQRVRGHWVQTSVEEIHAAQEFWRNRRGGTVTAREIVRMALGGADTSAGIRFEGVLATGWLGALLERLENKDAIEPLSTPDGFEGALRPYQEKGFAWLEFLRRWELGACLADDMGLGKTIQTLALTLRERNQGEDRPVLLVCPTSVLANWEHEAARFTPKLPVTIHHGPGRIKGYEFVRHAQDHAILLTSYALVHRDLEDFRSLRWAGVILDEAQNIKNPDTKQSQAVRAIRADYRVALTGTPVENHVGDLWSIMDFLNPEFLGTKEQFKRDFLVPIQAYRDPDATEQLSRITKPFILRRLKTDRSIISDLPEKLEMKVFCALTAEQGQLYESVVDEAERKIRDAEGIERRGVILATLSKLKQVCNHPAHFTGDGSELAKRSGKLTRLTEMLEEITPAGDRSLVFTQFAEMGKLLQSHLQDELGREVLFLHGGTPKKRRDAMIERFQSGEADAPPVFVLSLKAGGTGLNLTQANHVFHFDRWWNPAVENQATDRAFRIGQTRNVQVHKFVCVGTLEERVDEMIERKRTIAEDIVGTGEQWITELSDDELHAVFSLRRETVRD